MKYDKAISILKEWGDEDTIPETINLLLTAAMIDKKACLERLQSYWGGVLYQIVDLLNSIID